MNIIPLGAQHAGRLFNKLESERLTSIFSLFTAAPEPCCL